MKRNTILKRLDTIAETTGMQAILAGIKTNLEIIDGIHAMTESHPYTAALVNPRVLRNNLEDGIAMEIAILNGLAPKELALDEIHQDLVRDLVRNT